MTMIDNTGESTEFHIVPCDSLRSGTTLVNGEHHPILIMGVGVAGKTMEFAHIDSPAGMRQVAASLLNQADKAEARNAGQTP